MRLINIYCTKPTFTAFSLLTAPVLTSWSINFSPVLVFVFKNLIVVLARSSLVNVLLLDGIMPILFANS